jgi:hypothetical protein
MTLTCNNPSNNPLLLNYFQFILNRVPNMVYFCQSANLPGIGYGVAEQPTTLGHPVMVPTGAFRFEDLELTFRVDENLTNWRQIHSWIKNIGNYTDDENTLPYLPNKDQLGKTTDATLLITNSVYLPKIKVHFKHVFPQYLSGIKFIVNTPIATEAVATVKFAHTGYEIETLENS